MRLYAVSVLSLYEIQLTPHSLDYTIYRPSFGVGLTLTPLIHFCFHPQFSIPGGGSTPILPLLIRFQMLKIFDDGV